MNAEEQCVRQRRVRVVFCQCWRGIWDKQTRLDLLIGLMIFGFLAKKCQQYSFMCFNRKPVFKRWCQQTPTRAALRKKDLKRSGRKRRRDSSVRHPPMTCCCRLCTPHLELFAVVNCIPNEFTWVVLASVYASPLAKSNSACESTGSAVTMIQTQHSNAFLP